VLSRPPGWVLLSACLLGLLPALTQAAPKQQHATFRARVAPADPFHERNAVDSTDTKPLEVRRGEVFYLTIEGIPNPEYHTYPLTRRTEKQDEGQLSTVSFDNLEYFIPLYPIYESPPQFKDEGKEIGVLLEHEKPFTWVQPLRLKPNAPVGKTIDLKVNIHAIVCAKSCYSEDYSLTVPITVAAGPEVALSPENEGRLTTTAPPIAVVPATVPAPETAPASEKPNPSPTPQKEGPKSSLPPGLWSTILTALSGGFFSLLTPCVFPMIPITVSFFLKQAEKKHTRALPLAAVYSLTIVVVLTAGGLALIPVLQAISNSWITNFALAAIFLFFALSLLGMYDITLPSFLQELTSSREGQGGMIGACFMALTFSIISFACVGPIYGGFLTLEATAASGTASFVRWLAGPIAFSVAFASPFFLLALFPQVLVSLPKSGSWMNSVKVVMGFLEMAAVIKFLRSAELNLCSGRAEYLTFDLSLGIYVALALACGLYLLGLYRLPHDHGAPDSISVLRLMFSLVFVGVGLYLLPGMFKTDDGRSTRPQGELYTWVESFLLPEAEPVNIPGTQKNGSSTALAWHINIKEALADARSRNKLVFVDFTGTQCTNCKKNETGVFPRPEVKAALNRHVLLQLYVDQVPAGRDQQPDGKEAARLRDVDFNQPSGLPVYALIRPKKDGFDIVGVYTEGLIQDVPAFVEFLNKT
jgi:thiol:disulfide interchange protein DsbD